MFDMHIHMYITMGSTLVSTHSLCLLLLHLILLELLVLILDTAFTDVHSCDAFSYCHLCEVQYVFEIVSNCNGSNFLSNAQNFGCFFQQCGLHPPQLSMTIDGVQRRKTFQWSTGGALTSDHHHRLICILIV